MGTHMIFPLKSNMGRAFLAGDYFRKNTVRRTLSWKEQSREKKVPFSM